MLVRKGYGNEARIETVEKAGNRHCEERSDVAILLLSVIEMPLRWWKDCRAPFRELAMTAEWTFSTVSYRQALGGYGLKLFGRST